MAFAYFSLVWILVIYLFNCIVAKRFKKIDFLVAGVYISTVAVIGIFGEVFINTLCVYFFHSPLWLYHVSPIYNAYTSHYAVVTWGIYGFYLYLLHDSLQGYNIRSTKLLALWISLEAIVLELLLNISHFIIFKDYYFYYIPGDLWHLSTFLAIPFYFIAGIAIIKSVKRFKTDPKFFIAMNILLITVFALFA